MDETTKTESKVRRVRRTKAQIAADNAVILSPEMPKAENIDNDAMNAYALRIWSGQSPDLTVSERKTRVIAGLRGQGYDNFDGLKLPETTE